MLRYMTIVLSGLAATLFLTGCTVRTYPLTRDRIDQDLTTGNHGYLYGSAPAQGEHKKTRTTHVVEVELGSPLKFEKRSGVTETKESAPKAEMTPQPQPETTPAYTEEPAATPPPAAQEPSVQQEYENYTVQKGDTLQKISSRFFGTTKKWYKIFEANKDVLKTPDHLRPGQVIKIPAGLKTKGARKIK